MFPIKSPKAAQGLYHSAKKYLNVEVFETHYNGWTLWIKTSGKAAFAMGCIVSRKTVGSQRGISQQNHLTTKDRINLLTIIRSNARVDKNLICLLEYFINGRSSTSV